MPYLEECFFTVCLVERCSHPSAWASQPAQTLPVCGDVSSAGRSMLGGGSACTKKLVSPESVQPLQCSQGPDPSKYLSSCPRPVVDPIAVKLPMVSPALRTPCDQTDEQSSSQLRSSDIPHYCVMIL